MSPMSIESSEKVTHCLKKPQKMVDSVISDRICAFGFKLMNGGLVLTVLWSSNLILLLQLVSPSIFDLLMGLLRAGLSGLVDMGGEANAVFHVDSLSLPGVFFSAANAMVLSVGFGESEEFSDCAPLKIIAPNGLTTLVEQEGVAKVLSLEAKLNISGWVKHNIPGFSKLVGLSMSRHEKLCIALLQKLESEMEAANVLHKEVSGNRKVVKFKNKGRRELRNLVSSVNYDGR